MVFKKNFLILVSVFFLLAVFLSYTLLRNSKAQSFIAFGDTGTGTVIQYQLANTIKKECQGDCRGIILLGDIIYPDGIISTKDAQLLTKFELPFSKIKNNFYITIGNHDCTGCIECMIDYQKYSTKWIFPSRFYKQSFGNTDFFIIDSNEFSEQQRKWLESSLNKSKAKWKIVVGHHPLVSYDIRHKGKQNPYSKTIEKTICNKADLYISGHDHVMVDLGDRCGVRQIVSGGGGAPLGSLPQTVLHQFIEHGLVKISTTNLYIKVDFINVGGEVIYTWLKHKL